MPRGEQQVVVAVEARGASGGQGDREVRSGGSPTAPGIDEDVVAIVLEARSARAAQAEEELSPLYMAMNRKNASGEMDARTKEELEKKRKEALERIRNRKKQRGK